MRFLLILLLSLSLQFKHSIADIATSISTTTLRDLPLTHPENFDNTSLPAISPQLVDYRLTAFDDPQGYGRFADEVYVKGRFVKPWSTCRDETQVGSVDSNCLVDSEYNDRLVFSFSFSQKENWTFEAPTMEDRQNVGDATVENFALDTNKERGSFTVKYNCRKEDLGDEKKRMFMMMKIPVMKNYTMKLLWAKMCRGGKNDNIRYGYIMGDKSETMGDGGKRLEVSPLDMTTTLYFELEPGGYLQGFGKPTMESDSDRVIVSVRGVSLGGILSSEKQTRINAIYECKGHAKAKITLKLPVPPFDDLVVEWIKDCGGGLPKGLMIGTKPGAKDVIEHGRAHEAFESQEYTPGAVYKRELNRSSLKVVSPDIMNIEFYFKNENMDTISPLHFDQVISTVSESKVLRVQPSQLSGSYFSSEGGLLRPGESKTLDLRMVCLKAGSSIVTVTLPLLKYRNMEFSFIKMCVAPKEHQELFHWWNVGAIEDIVLLGVAVGVVFCCVIARKRTAPKYRRLNARRA